MYRYETHLHTSEVSLCAGVPAREMVRLYAAAGFSGLIVTDHFNQFTFDHLGGTGWKESAERYLTGYHLAKDEGEKVGVAVFLGAELLVEGSNNEYLLYGINEDFIYQNEGIFTYDLVQLRNVCTDANVLIYQAHPYRDGMVRAMPGFLDGVEVYNACPRHDSRNEMSLKFAMSNHLGMSSGSDAHLEEDVGRGGIETEKRITSIEEFRDVLISGEYELIRSEEKKKKKRFFI